MNKQPLINSLMRKGFSLLRSLRYGDALAVGRKLKRLRHSSAFEIMALAYLRLGVLTKAIAILEEGVAKAGRVWLLWELLGNCYSDAKRYDAAEKAYQEALLREHCDAQVIHLNRAIAFERADKYKDAASAIRKVVSPRLGRRADEVRISVSIALGNKRVAAKQALKLCRQRASVDDLDPRSESSILATCARALMDSPRTRRKARNLAYRAARVSPANSQALFLIRELDAHHSAGSSLFNLLIHGVWNEPFRRAKMPPGFFRSCQVYAPNQATAFRYAKLFFPPEVRSSLSIEESKVLPCDDLVLDGVYSVTGLMFYPRKSLSA